VKKQGSKKQGSKIEREEKNFPILANEPSTLGVDGSQIHVFRSNFHPHPSLKSTETAKKLNTTTVALFEHSGWK